MLRIYFKKTNNSKHNNEIIIPLSGYKVANKLKWNIKYKKHATSHTYTHTPCNTLWTKFMAIIIHFLIKKY